MKSKTISILLIFALSVMIALPMSVLAGTSGKLSGTIVGEETGEPLPGVAVSIVGTVMGGLTNEDGEYFILNVPVGTHVVKVSLIGYAPVEITNVKVSVDLTTYNDITLSKKALDLGRTIRVTSERPLIIRDKTATMKIIETEDIENMPTRGYQDIVGFQAGVVAFRDNPGVRQRASNTERAASNTAEINIRGGRPSEVAYFVDGFSQQDPLSGLSSINISSNSLAEIEITTGGFNAEYGWVASGIINATTKEGAQKYSGAVEVITDNIGEQYDYNVYTGNVSGPIPGLEGSTFFLSGERRWQGDRQPSGIMDEKLPSNWLGGWSGHGKLSYKVNDNMNVKAGAMYSRDNWSQYLHTYRFNIEHTPRYLDLNQSGYVKWTHTLSPKTFYTLAGSYFQTERMRGDGLYFTDVDLYARPDWPGSGNPAQDGTGLFWQWDGIYDTSGVTTPDTDEGHIWDDYLRRKSSYIGIDADISSQVTNQHLLKFGFDFQRNTLRYFRSLFPANADTINVDNYGYDRHGLELESSDETWRDEAKHPLTWALYLQDKFEWNDMVINAGVRYDYFNTNTKWVKDIQNPFAEGDTDSLELVDLEDSDAETRISPRIGVGFPVSDRTVLHFSYGKFFQRPELNRLYVNYRYYEYKVKSGGYYYSFGNPNLAPEEITAFEFGVSHQLNDNTAFEVTGYYKDAAGLTQATTVTDVAPKSYSIFLNEDFGTVKGLDFSLKMRRTQKIALDLAYSLSWATGTGSYATTQRNVTWTLSEVPRFANPLTYDQRHKFTGIIDVRFGKGEGPLIGDIYPLENAGINFIVNLASGTPYTPSQAGYDPVTLFAVTSTPAGSINSRYSPWRFRIDMKASKTLFFDNGISLDFYVWIMNLLDRDNVLTVYETSGDPDATNWLVTESGETFIENNSEVIDTSDLNGEEKYILASQHPGNYDIPRQIRFGLRLSF